MGLKEQEVQSEDLMLKEGRNILIWNRASFFVYGLLIPALIAYHSLNRAKFIYFLPLVMLVIPFLETILKGNRGKSLKYEPNMVFSLFLYVILVLIGLSFNAATINYKILIRDILILLSPLVVFSLEMKFTDRHIKWLFIAIVISYFAWVGIDLEFDFSFNFIRSNYNLSSEFHNGVIIGCFFLFFLNRKMFLWALVAIILIFMSGKRSIFLGLLPAIATWYLFIGPLKIYNKKYLLAFILIAYFGVFYAVGVNFDSFALWFLDWSDMDRQVTLDRFLMGREIFIVYLKNQIAESEILQYLFGYGPGQADVFVHDVVRPDWGAEKRDSVNPHNDFLKMRFDYGLIGSLLLFNVFYSSYIKSKIGIQMFLYTIPLFLVDNSFIFIYYWFIAMTISRVEVKKSD